MHRSTRLLHDRRVTPSQGTPVNPPLVRASTHLQPTIDALLAADADGAYGANGTDTHRALEAAAASLYGGAAGARAAPSGLAACTLVILALAAAGDRVLASDNLYGPTRDFLTRTAARYRVEATFFDPHITPGALEGLIDARTRLLFLESPGSITFEVSDTPALCAVAHAHGLIVALDDTWSAGVFSDPLALGVDVAVQAATKYWAGHADAMCGVIIARTKEVYDKIDRLMRDMGLACGVDEAWLTLRGLRTLHARLRMHEANGYALAHHLEARFGPERVLHPGLSGHPDHALWKRDFTGACGLFGLTTDAPWETCKAFCDALALFGKGFSWGGYESLVTPWRPFRKRSVSAWPEGRHVIRFHAGLEDAADLVADIDQALGRHPI